MLLHGLGIKLLAEKSLNINIQLLQLFVLIIALLLHVSVLFPSLGQLVLLYLIAVSEHLKLCELIVARLAELADLLHHDFALLAVHVALFYDRLLVRVLDCLVLPLDLDSGGISLQIVEERLRVAFALKLELAQTLELLDNAHLILIDVLAEKEARNRELFDLIDELDFGPPYVENVQVSELFQPDVLIDQGVLDAELVEELELLQPLEGRELGVVCDDGLQRARLWEIVEIAYVAAGDVDLLERVQVAEHRKVGQVLAFLRLHLGKAHELDRVVEAPRGFVRALDVDGGAGAAGLHDQRELGLLDVQAAHLLLCDVAHVQLDRLELVELLGLLSDVLLRVESQLHVFDDQPFQTGLDWL